MLSVICHPSFVVVVLVLFFCNCSSRIIQIQYGAL